MAERVVTGQPASPGAAVGPAWVVDSASSAGESARDVPRDLASRGAEAARAAAALEGAGDELDALADRLRHEGRTDEADIVAAGALMARDPMLGQAVDAAVLEGGRSAAEALRDATDAQADLLAAIDDATLAARADDVRSVGRRAARVLAGGASAAMPQGAIVVADDLGPADVAEYADRAAAFALAGGGTTAHAAIVARSLGLPMVTGAGADIVAAARDGATVVVVDGDAGVLVLDPAAERVTRARTDADARAAARARASDARDLSATMTDGHTITVLANVAAPAEVALALAAGAEGVGLVRTELAFLDARSWPTEAEHRRALDPILAPLAGRPVTVRVLDFGGDKLPPFLLGESARGIALLLTAPDALAAQLRAIVAAGRDAGLRIMLPLVESPDELDAVRALLGPGVPLGAMVETPAAAARAGELARHADFLSIGTNDLTAATTGVDRFTSGAVAQHDPRVLRHIKETAVAAAAAGIPLEVCGEAASDPVLSPLLVGLGARELSVGASRVGTVRAWMRSLSLRDCVAAAEQAVRAVDARGVEALALLEGGDDAGQGVEGGAGVVAVGPQA